MLSGSDTWWSGFPARLQDSHPAWTAEGQDCQGEEEDGKIEPDVRNSSSLGKERGSEGALWKYIYGISLTCTCFNLCGGKGSCSL